MENSLERVLIQQNEQTGSLKNKLIGEKIWNALRFSHRIHIVKFSHTMIKVTFVEI